MLHQQTLLFAVVQKGLANLTIINIAVLGIYQPDNCSIYKFQYVPMH